MGSSVAVVGTALNGVSRVSARLAGAGAFALFRAPLARGRLRPGEREIVAAARTGSLEVNGKTAVTYLWGDGTRPVLFAHGWQSRGSRCADLIPGLLRRGHSVVAFDAPGHGEATGRTTTILEYRDIITRLHDRYGDFDAVVAHSLGVLASFFALRHGVRAERVVALGGVVDFAYLLDAFCAKLGLSEPVKEELRGRIERDLFPGEPAIWTRFSVLDRPEELRVPILVLHDEDDDMVTPTEASRVVAAYGEQARLITTRGLGHRRMLGDPEVVRTVLDFVAPERDRQPAR
ncbi:alpha/beta fold hydrolase [Nonomuraea sp. NPDC050383]|uniref:alpha/beta fold hydrolase n=1 Tax=Nonomuraea sp. NPDC050383 TaxID=3364362 RepID=UPI0037A265DC